MQKIFTNPVIHQHKAKPVHSSFRAVGLLAAGAFILVMPLHGCKDREVQVTAHKGGNIVATVNTTASRFHSVSQAAYEAVKLVNVPADSFVVTVVTGADKEVVQISEPKTVR